MNKIDKSKELMKAYQDNELLNMLKESNRIFVLSFILVILIFILIIMLVLFTQRVEFESNCNISNLNYDSNSNSDLLNIVGTEITYRSGNPIFNLNNSSIQCNFKGKIPQYTLFTLMR